MIHPRTSYWLMFGSAATFAAMSACAHALKDRCDWRVVTIARAGLAIVFTFLIAKLQHAPLAWPGPKTLWVRSIAGSLGMLCAFYTLTHMPISGSMKPLLRTTISLSM